ncbi:MAG: NusG domain II-containing protein [Anaeroplasma sp.]
MRKFKNDVFLIAGIFVVLLIGLIVYGFVTSKSGKQAVVYKDSEIMMTIDLDENNEYIIQGEISELIIIVSDGKIKVKESGCENQYCVLDGYISRENEVIVCLPNHIYIKIIGSE